MRTLTCAPPGWTPSSIRIGHDLDWADELGEHTLVVADRRVLELNQDLPGASQALSLEGGENAKTIAGLEALLHQLADRAVPRQGRILAIGGGTIGDLCGTAAALYLRGIEWVQVPTTLLSMLDSSVGGKTGVNLPHGKNLAGQFWPAARVAIDLRFLPTLPEREFRSGLGEAIKMGLGLDSELFALLETETDAILARDPDVMSRVIELAVAAKIRVVESDPDERGDRRLLNLGHTLGHAIEAHANYELAHGLAVARGIHFALRVAEQRGALAEDEARRARDLLVRYGFAEDPLPAWSDLEPFVLRDKKVVDGAVRFVVPTGIGSSRTEPIASDELAELAKR